MGGVDVDRNAAVLPERLGRVGLFAGVPRRTARVLVRLGLAEYDGVTSSGSGIQDRSGLLLTVAGRELLGHLE